MSPEQVNLAPNIDGRADLWAVGVILYQLLTGTLPFASPNVAEVLAFILEKDPAPLASFRPDVPPGIDAVIARCLAKDPAQRFPGAAELAAALGPFGPWASAGGRLGALPDPSRASLPDAAEAAFRGTSTPALTHPGYSTDKKPADARSPILRMIGLGAGIGAALLAVLVVVASRPAAPAATATSAVTMGDPQRVPQPPPVMTAAAVTTAATVTTASTVTTAAPSATATAGAASAISPAPIATATGGPLKPGSTRKSALSRQRN
jgi:serine/threonine-protein kinase